jgi:hypothetical protein
MVMSFKSQWALDSYEQQAVPEFGGKMSADAKSLDWVFHIDIPCKRPSAVE